MIFNSFITKMTEPNTAWVQTGEAPVSLSLPFTRSEFKAFHTFWKEFVLLEYIKVQEEKGVISYLGLRPFTLLNKVWNSTLIQPFPVGGEKKQRQRLWWKCKIYQQESMWFEKIK